jgi:hypothetical protein
VAACGTHAQLLSQPGYYRETFSLQHPGEAV